MKGLNITKIKCLEVSHGRYAVGAFIGVLMKGLNIMKTIKCLEVTHGRYAVSAFIGVVNFKLYL